MRVLSYDETANTPPISPPHRYDETANTLPIPPPHLFNVGKRVGIPRRTAKPSLRFATLVMRNKSRMSHMQVKIP